MIASHITYKALADAALRTDVTFFNYDALSATRHRFRLLPLRPYNYRCTDHVRCWAKNLQCPECSYLGHRKLCLRCKEGYVQVTRATDGTRHEERIAPKRVEMEPRYIKYQRMNRDGSHALWALCWHGFRDFFRECYLTTPNAQFRTGLRDPNRLTRKGRPAPTIWRSREDFEARYFDTGYRNIGSQMSPMAYGDACRCSNNGDDSDEFAQFYLDRRSRLTLRTHADVDCPLRSTDGNAMSLTERFDPSAEPNCLACLKLWQPSKPERLVTLKRLDKRIIKRA